MSNYAEEWDKYEMDSFSKGYIKGSKGGEKKQHTPVESPDNIRSIAKAKILVALGEGEFEGNPTAKDIYLDDTPLQSEDGSMNFRGVKWEYRNGSVFQDYIKGMPSVENEYSINYELRRDAPYIRSINNTNLSAVRVRLSFPQMVRHKSNGDVVGSSVRYAIDISTDGGSYVTMLDETLTCKTTTKYERSRRVDLPESSTGWTLRVRRITADSTSASTSNDIICSGVTEIVDAKLRYPNTALLYVEFDAEQFQNTPKISVRVKGRKWPVPSNYDPISRTYSGVWDGVFKQAWTDNPVWISYGIMTHERLGLGKRLKQENIDKWELYRISQYCDQLVSDGKGGREPRFICNMYIQSRSDAWSVLRDLSAIYRGMTYWSQSYMHTVADMPRDIDYIFTRSNVVDGIFTFAGSTERDVHTRCIVSYDDPNNMYNSDTTAVADLDLYRRFGDNLLELTAIGCTRESEAQRRGKWALYTNSNNRTVTFKVGLDGAIPLVGHIIGISEQMLSGRNNGGRIKSVGSDTEITLDRNSQAKSGDVLVINLPSGKSEQRSIKSVSIGGDVITVNSRFSEMPSAELQWGIEYSDLALQQFRVTSIKRDSSNTFTIEGVKHNPNKYAYVDDGARLEERPITVIPPSEQIPPSEVTISSDYILEQSMAVTTLTINWDMPKNAIKYDVEWQKDDGDWVISRGVTGNSLEIKGIYSGNYIARVKAYNSIGIGSVYRSSTLYSFEGKKGTPPTLINFRASPIVMGITLDWDFPLGATDSDYTEIRYNTTPNIEGEMLLGNYSYPTDTHTLVGMGSARSLFFRGRLVDKSGNVGEFTDWIQGTSSADSEEILDYLVGKIGDTELSQKLRDEIEKISGISDELGQQGVDISELESLIEQLELQITDITGTQNWDSTTSYLAGSLVQDEGALYRAKKDTPAGILVSNSEYWEKVGDYASIGEAVIALNIQVSNMQAAVDEATGSVKAQGEVISTLVAKARGERADGDKADALEGWNTQSQISERDRVEASDKEALAERLLVIDAEVGDNKSQISSLQQAFVDEGISTAERLDKIIASRPVRADGDKADALGGFKSQAQIVEASRVQASDSEASAERDLLMQAELDNTNAALQLEQQVRSNADEALSTSIQTQQAELFDTNAALEQVSEVVVGIDEKVSTSWSVRMQVNQNGQYVYAGVGLGIENVGGVLQSQFLIEANRFALLNTLNGVTTSPFIVDGGQVFMNSAVIKQADIVNLIITGELRSGDYVEGEKGIRLNFLSGQFEMNGTVAGEGSMTINNQRLEVKDNTGLVRVRLGRL